MLSREWRNSWPTKRFSGWHKSRENEVVGRSRVATGLVAVVAESIPAGLWHYEAVGADADAAECFSNGEWSIHVSARHNVTWRGRGSILWSLSVWAILESGNLCLPKSGLPKENADFHWYIGSGRWKGFICRTTLSIGFKTHTEWEKRSWDRHKADVWENLRASVACARWGYSFGPTKLEPAGTTVCVDTEPK